jgi:hypothetical protein
VTKTRTVLFLLLLAAFGCAEKSAPPPVPNQDAAAASTPAERHVTAVHEAGHAVYAWFDTDFAVGPVSVSGRAGNASLTYPNPPAASDLWRIAASAVASGQAVFQETNTVPNGLQGDDIFLESAADNLLGMQAVGKNISPPWKTGRALPPRYAMTDVQILSTFRASDILAAHPQELRRVAAELERCGILDTADLARLLGPRPKP